MGGGKYLPFVTSLPSHSLSLLVYFMIISISSSPHNGGGRIIEPKGGEECERGLEVQAGPLTSSMGRMVGGLEGR